MPEHSWKAGQWPFWSDAPAARIRVIVDNDFAGDPDDLFQVAHHLLSPSVDVRGVICSHLREGDPFYSGNDSADQARRVMQGLADAMHLDTTGLLYTGSNTAIRDRMTPQDTEAARFIIEEALREDDRPLYVVAGGGLTDIASAWLLEPRISEKLTLIWIGGPEHEGLGYEPPIVETPEYNLAIDVQAGQVVFNDSDLPLWIVPRNMYRQCLVSQIELKRRVRNLGPLGQHLYSALEGVRARMTEAGELAGETYALGDSPLVLLTALQSFFQPDPSSSDYALRACPGIAADGAFEKSTEGRAVRVYHRLDVRLMFEDMFLKFDELSRWLND